MLIDMRDAFFEELVLQAQLNPNIIILSADHGALALEEFARTNPKQYINIGIAEQNMVGVAAGLAASGKIVFIYGITPFVSLRILEHLTIDVAAMQLPVNVISVGAGFTYSTDGPTHQGLQDLAAILSVPGMRVLNSSDPSNTSDFVQKAIEEQKPSYIRIEKEKLQKFMRLNVDYIKDGYSLLTSGNSNLMLISTGSISHDVQRVISSLTEKGGKIPTHIDLHQLKPLSADSLIDIAKRFTHIILIDEGFASGFQQALSEFLLRSHWQGEIQSLCVSDATVYSGDSRTNLKELQNIGLSDIELQIRKILD